MATKEFDHSALQSKATEVADLLRALANEQRLMILCKLVEWGEANVTSLSEAIGLNQSALSQHLARLRDMKIVAFRRDAQQIWYRIADPRVERLLATFHQMFCAESRSGPARARRKS